MPDLHDLTDTATSPDDDLAALRIVARHND